MPTPATFGQPGQWPGRLRGRLLIIRWESRTWTRSASPRLRAGGCLYAMAAATASDAWAVGCAGRNGFSGTGADRVPGRRLVEEGAGRARCRVKRPVRRRRLLRPGCVGGRPRGLEQDARRALGRVGVAAGVQHVVVVRARLRGLRHGAQPALRVVVSRRWLPLPEISVCRRSWPAFSGRPAGRLRTRAGGCPRHCSPLPVFS